MDNINLRHRSVLRHNYTRTSNVLLFGYRGVSDSAKITYQAIDSFDWTLEGGVRKGYAHPTLGRIANLLGSSERTVRRHLRELEKAGLVTRQERPGYSNVLYIEDPSADQAEQYLKAIAPEPSDSKQDGRAGGDEYSDTPDTLVRPPRTQMSAPPIQGSQKEEVKINVEQALVEERRGEGSGSTHISTTLQRRQMELRAKRTAAADQRAEVLADELASRLHDSRSRLYYLGLARTVPSSVLFETLALVQEATRLGHVRNRGALFVSILRQRSGDTMALSDRTLSGSNTVEELSG